jgi:hypothetical protein
VADVVKPKKSQNKQAVATTLTVVKAIGEIIEGVICLTAITVVPKKKLAKMTARIAL